MYLRGRSSLSDEFHEGRPVRVVTEENVAAVSKLIEENNRVTYNFIHAFLEIGISQIQKILHNHLHVKINLCSLDTPKFNTGPERGTCQMVQEHNETI